MCRAPYPPTVTEALKRLAVLEQEVADLHGLMLAQLGCDDKYPDGTAPHPDALSRGHILSPMRDHWGVSCLGRFRLRCAERPPAPCPSRRGWGVLLYLLAMPGYAATPEALLEAFWPDTALEAGNHNLQVAISTLRRALRGCGPAGSNATVLCRDGHYLINPAITIDQDTERFRAAFTRGNQAASAGRPADALHAWETARACYGGPFLADRLFDEWTAVPRIALQESYLAVLSSLAIAYVHAADWVQAADCCREILAIDPYREDAYRQLMRCQAAGARLAEVHRTYGKCREQLRRDLQIDPAPETTRLYVQLIEQSTETGRILSENCAPIEGSRLFWDRGRANAAERLADGGSHVRQLTG